MLPAFHSICCMHLPFPWNEKFIILLESVFRLFQLSSIKLYCGRYLKFLLINYNGTLFITFEAQKSSAIAQYFALARGFSILKLLIEEFSSRAQRQSLIFSQ